MSKFQNHVSRVDQLDASALDQELLTILSTHITRAFEEFHPSWLLTMEPELIALLRVILWKLTVVDRGATLGQRLLLLEYKGHKGQKINQRRSWYLAGIEIGSRWLNDRIKLGLLNILNPPSKDKALLFLKWLHTLVSLSRLLNHLQFLRTGHYMSLSERIVGITSGNAGPKSIREVQYEYMNRELLWHGLSDFLTFLIPLINVHRLKNCLARLLSSGGRPKSSPLERVSTDLAICAFCEESPILPHDIGCKHVFCYYCIQSNVLADARFQCPKCDNNAQGVESIRPVTAILNPDY